MIYKNKIRINKCFPKAVSICISVSVSVYIGAGPQWAFYTESFEFSLGLGSSFHLLDLFLIVNCISFVTAQESMMVSDKTVKNAPTCQQLFSKIHYWASKKQQSKNRRSLHYWTKVIVCIGSSFIPAIMSNAKSIEHFIVFFQ